MNDIGGILGLALRARKIVSGESVLKSIQNQSAKLILISDSCGENSKKKLLDKCKFYEIPYEFIDDTLLNQAIGTSNRKSVSIVDQGFAQKLIICLKG